jgi:two-component system, OmpR family, phosphate regulon sensor histidine kinase PhoR
VSQDQPIGSLPRRGLRIPAPSTVSGRLALTYAVVVAVALAIFGLVLAQQIRAISMRQLETDVLQEARLALSLAVSELELGGAGLMQPLADRMAENLTSRVTIVTGPSDLIADSQTDPATVRSQVGWTDFAIARNNGTHSAVHRNIDGQEMLFVTVAGDGPANVVTRVGRPLAPVDETIREIQRMVLLGTLLAALLVAIVGIGVGRRISQPLFEVRREAMAVAAGDLTRSVEPATTRELGDLGRAFNLMVRQLEGSVLNLERVQQRMETTLLYLTDGVVLTDGQGIVLDQNRAAALMLGAGEEAEGRAFVTVARDYELDHLLQQALAGPEQIVTGMVRHGPSGQMFDVIAQRIETETESLGLIVIRDVTEMQRLEGVRREFVANVSHELRTPLASIRAAVETLEAGAIEDRALADDLLARVIIEVDRLTMLVDELLDLARLEAGGVDFRRAPVDAWTLIGDGVARLAPQIERAGLDLTVDIPADLPDVRADPARIEQVLLNLVHNAIKFTPEGGHISVAARAVDGMVEIEVRDDGVGIDPDDVPRLFERFYKVDRARQSEGTGLGLAIAKHIVQGHGGSISARSEPGTGSSFTFTLPTT